MKIKNKVLATALGIATLTGGMLLANQTNASAIAYSNNGGALTDGGTTLENVKMTVTTAGGMIPMQNFNDFIISSSTSQLFSANKNYKITIVTSWDFSNVSSLKINLIDANGNNLKSVSLTTTSELKTDASMPYHIYTSTGTISATQEFKIKLSDATMAMDGSLSERTFDSISVVEADTTAPTITISQNNLTYEVGTNNITAIQIATAFSSANDNNDGVVSTYLVSSNVDFNKVGRYTIVVGAKDSAGNESTANVYVNIVDRQAPVINGWQGVYYTNYDSPTTLDNVLGKISAYDEYKGSVPVNVVSDGYTGKENILGDHIVKLSASDGTNTTEITINIIVVDATKPTISGPTSLTSNMSSPMTEASIRAKLSASDNADNSLTINLVQDNFSANKLKKGSYTISYNTTDDSGNVSDTFVVTITNKDDIKPTISGSTSIEAGSSTQLTINEIKSKANLIASDNIDSGLAINLVEDNYSSNYSQVGNHTIKFNTTDNSGNISETFTLTIVVKDTTKPVISGSNSIRSNLSSPLTEENIRSQLTATDNVDANLTINLVEDLFTDNADIVGTYQVKYNVTDSAGNMSEIFVVEVEVYDDIAPTISGKNEYSVSPLAKLDVNKLLKVLTATDNVDAGLTLNIVSDNYSNSSSILGDYQVVVNVQDDNGNVSNNFTITIHVIDNIAPYFFVSKDIIFVDDTLTLTHQQIVDALLSQANINTAMVMGFNVETDYFNSPTTANVYSVMARVVLADGSEQELHGSIEVIATEDEEDTIIKETTEDERNEQKANALKEIGKDVLKMLKNVWEFFVKLFKTIIFGWAWDKDGRFDPKWTEWH